MYTYPLKSGGLGFHGDGGSRPHLEYVSHELVALNNVIVIIRHSVKACVHTLTCMCALSPLPSSSLKVLYWISLHITSSSCVVYSTQPSQLHSTHYCDISTTHLAQESSGRSSTPMRTSLSGTLPSSSVERMSLKQERCVWRSLRAV